VCSLRKRIPASEIPVGTKRIVAHGRPSHAEYKIA